MRALRRAPVWEDRLIWKEEIQLLDQMVSRLTNLGADVGRQMVQYESRKTTLENEIVKLDADYSVLISRNEEARKAFQQSQRLDLEKLGEDQRRVKAKELALFEKEKELQKLKSELEMQIAQAKTAKNTIEAIGRQHGKK